MNLRIDASFVEAAKAVLGEVVRIEYFTLDLLNEVLLCFEALRLAIETVDQSHPYPHLQFLLFSLGLLEQIAAEPVLRLKDIHVSCLLDLSGSQLGSLQVDPFIQLSIEEDRIEDVDHVFPNLEVDHHCHLLDFDLQLLAVHVERHLQTRSLPALRSTGHESIRFQFLRPHLRLLALTQSEQLLQAVMLVLGGSKFDELGLPREIVLIHIGVLECSRIHLVKLLTN